MGQALGPPSCCSPPSPPVTPATRRWAPAMQQGFWLAAVLKGFPWPPAPWPPAGWPCCWAGRLCTGASGMAGEAAPWTPACPPPLCGGFPPHLCPITSGTACTKLPLSPPSSVFFFFFFFPSFHRFSKIWLKRRKQRLTFPSIPNAGCKVGPWSTSAIPRRVKKNTTPTKKTNPIKDTVLWLK